MAVLLALALVLADVLAAAAAPPPAKIALDVLVRDAKGRTVDQLTSSDLTVTEGDEPRPIESVRFVRASGDPPPKTPDGTAVDPAGRLLAIFLDEYHVRPGAAAESAREALAAFVSGALGPTDRLVVLKPLDPLGDIVFTADRAAALRAIETFSPRADDLTARTEFEQNYIAGAPAQIAAARAQIATASIGALTRTLGALGSGRKTLIVVSDGFVLRRVGRRGDAVLPGFDEIAATANRVNVSIYPAFVADSAAPEPGGDTTAQPDAAEPRAALERIAADTAGAVVRRDQMTSGLRAALDDASGYYEITLAQPLTPAGRLHRLQVAVRRSGAVVRARSAYGGPVLRVEPLTPAPPRRLVVPRRTSPLIQPWFGMSPAADGTTRVSFVWEPAPRVAGDRTPRLAPARVSLQVTADDGTTLFEGVVAASGSSAVSAAVAPQTASFSSAGGRVFVQMSIEDAAATRLDSDARDILVTRFPAPLALGSTAIFRTRTARDFEGLLADGKAAPVAARQFSRAERLLLRVPIVTTTDAPAVSARLLNDRGGAVRELVVSRPGRPGEPLQIDLPLAPFPVGGYAVEIVVKEAGREARERVAFRVTP